MLSRHHDRGGVAHLQMVLLGHGLGGNLAQVCPRSFEPAPQGAPSGSHGCARLSATMQVFDLLICWEMVDIS